MQSLKLPEVQQTFQRDLSKGLRERTNDGSIEGLWGNIQSAICNAAKSAIPSSLRPKNPWISVETLKLVEQRRSCRLSLPPAELRRLNASIQRAIRHDKHVYWNNHAERLEHEMQNGSSRNAYRLLKISAGKFSPRAATVLDKDGKNICSIDGCINRWREHFDELLNRPVVDKAPDDLFAGVSEPYQCHDLPPTKAEIVAAIAHLQNNKAPGDDNIFPEELKFGGDVLVTAFEKLFHLIWEQESIPSSWENAILLPFFKKGAPNVCYNYRGISLLSCALKVLESVILARLRADREKTCRENQAGFRQGRSCVDQIFCLRQILQRRHQFNLPTYVAFVDFAAAFDSVDRDSLWKIMSSCGVPDKLLAIIKAMYTHTSSTVRIGASTSAAFDLTTGVRQGGVLSPFLFNFVIDWILNGALCDFGYGVSMPGSPEIYADLDFADDVALLADSPFQLEVMLRNVDYISQGVGLFISGQKTKILRCVDGPDPNISIAGRQIECVDSFCYLGSTIDKFGGSGNDIRLRIGKATGAFSTLNKQFWKRKDISINTKYRVYNAMVRSILLYGCETWPLRKGDVEQLCAFERRCLRKLLRLSARQHLAPETVKTLFPKHVELSIHLQRRQLTWLGHVLRMPTSRFPRKLFLTQPPKAKKRPGGQRLMWEDTVRTSIEKGGIKRTFGSVNWTNNWREILATVAIDRVQWSTLVDNAVFTSSMKST
jgi:hypothetical protein